MAYPSTGTILKRGNGGGPEAFAAIAQVRDITPPALSMDTHETTHQTSTNAMEEFVAGIRRTGEVSFAINYDPTDNTHDSVEGLIADWRLAVQRNFQLIFPTPGTPGFQFAAFVTGFAPTAPVNGSLSADVTLKLTGPMTFLNGA